MSVNATPYITWLGSCPCPPPPCNPLSLHLIERIRQTHGGLELFEERMHWVYIRQDMFRYIYVYICQCKYIYTYSCTHANIACHVHMPGLLVCISTASSGFIGLLLLLRKPIPRVIANSLSNEWQPEGRYDAQGWSIYIYVCMFILKYTCIHTCFGFGSICVSNGAWLGSWVHKDLPASTAGSVARCSGDAPLSSAWCRLCPCLSMPKK